MAKKKKEKEKSNFTSWEQVGNALCEITQINTRVKAAEVQMERDKLTITNAYEQKVRDDLAHKEQLEKDMKLYSFEDDLYTLSWINKIENIGERE